MEGGGGEGRRGVKEKEEKRSGWPRKSRAVSRNKRSWNMTRYTSAGREAAGLGAAGMRVAGMGVAEQKQKGRISKDESSRNGSCGTEAGR